MDFLRGTGGPGDQGSDASKVLVWVGSNDFGIGVEPHCDPWHQFIQGLRHISGPFTSGPLRWLGALSWNYSDLFPGSLPNLKGPSCKKVSIHPIRLDGYESPQALWVALTT